MKWKISITGVFNGIPEVRQTVARDYNTAQKYFETYKTLARCQVGKQQATRYNRKKQETISQDKAYILFTDEYGNTLYSVLLDEIKWE